MSSSDLSGSWTVGPVAPIAGAPDLISQARSRVIVQYRQSTKLLAFIDAIVSPFQEIANNAVIIGQLDDTTIATGVNLDVIGQLVGQFDRQLAAGDSADDAEMQILIGARISRNSARVSSADYLAALVQFFGATVLLNDSGGMAISYVVMRAPTSDEIAVLNEDIVARPMGVKVSRSFSPGSGYFGWSDDPNALGFSEISDGGTTGGFWTELF